VEIRIGKLKRYKFPGTDHIPAKLIKARSEILCSEIHKLICSIWNKDELPQQWKLSITVPIYMKSDKTDGNNYSKNLPLINCLQNVIQRSSGQVNSVCE
jgi:hypothetical protein